MFVADCRFTGVVPEGMTSSSVTVIVPTYREAANLRPLLDRLAGVRAGSEHDLEVLIVDDDSRDGSERAVEDFAAPWAQIVVRRGARGLSCAVVEGIRRARGDIVVVMDADLSHPPEKIPALCAALAHADVAIGSRYVHGGSTDDDWGAWRLFKSRIATLLARPLTSAADPMAGFFAIRRADVDTSRLAPVGYKILLELIVRCDLRRVVEVPIHFSDRASGESKLTIREELLFVEHLRRLYAFSAAAWFGSRTNRGSSASGSSARAARDDDRSRAPRC